MATFIEDGRLIVDEDGVRTDLTDQVRTVATALSHLPASIPSARMGAPLFELGQDVANSFGMFDEPDPGAVDSPATVFLLVQEDEDTGADASVWVLDRASTITDGRLAAEKIVEVLSGMAWSVEQLEDSAPWR